MLLGWKKSLFSAELLMTVGTRRRSQVYGFTVMFPVFVTVL